MRHVAPFCVRGCAARAKYVVYARTLSMRQSRIKYAEHLEGLGTGRAMDPATTWETLEALIKQYFPKAGCDRRPLPMQTVLRIDFFQQCSKLSDPLTEDFLYASELMLRFTRIDVPQSATSWKRTSSRRASSIV